MANPRRNITSRLPQIEVSTYTSVFVKNKCLTEKSDLLKYASLKIISNKKK